MIKHYDFIVIGAGIAGSGVSYNLRKEFPSAKILLIDKKEAGANAAYGYRNTTKNIIKKYKIPYVHKYKGIKGGIGNKTLFKLDKEFYLFNYSDCCQKLINESYVDFRVEEAIALGPTTLKTSESVYKFKFLVDCSGHNFFAKKILKLPKPLRYWIGITKTLKNKLNNNDYFYYQFSDNGYSEDIYPMKNETLQGDWKYVKKVDFKLLKIPKETLFQKKIPMPQVTKVNRVVIPCTPALPIVKNNIFFLGDSFGNPTTSSAEGIAPILETSEILVNAIKQKSLKLYEKSWKRKYLDNYIKFLVLKYYGYNDSELKRKIKGVPKMEVLCKKLAKYPEIFEKILMCDSSISMPKEIKKIYPLRKTILQTGYYTYLNLKLC